MRKRNGAWGWLRLTLLFAFTVFLIMLLTTVLVFAGMFLLNRLDLAGSPPIERSPFFVFAMVSLIVGTILAALLSHAPLKPIREIMAATDQIAGGDYSVRIHLKGPEEFRQLSDKFNHMAAELGSVELLRNDFINNFSHEFKTPIVSVRGFAKMLRNNNLTAEERNEYLDIIIEESERLAELSTNVLNLSKIEQQSILTDKRNFNVSEQIRLVVALLDGKLAEKQLQVHFDCGEFFFTGNEEMLRQVWINLLDNAIKYSPAHSTIEIQMEQKNGRMTVAVANQGESIPPEAAAHIFEKFYQGDTSHTTKGNGLGLTIAKRIIELHGGTIRLIQPEQGKIVFEVNFMA